MSNNAANAAPNRSFDPREEVIEEFLGAQPRAELWHDLAGALRERLNDAVAARDAAGPHSPDHEALNGRVEELKEQVRVLAEEAAITQFVEESVRASLSRPRRPGMPFGDEDYEDDGGPY
jgi:hypothetical protein